MKSTDSFIHSLISYIMNYLIISSCRTGTVLGGAGGKIMSSQREQGSAIGELAVW